MAANLELVYKCLLNCFLVGLGKRSKLPDPRMRIQRQNPQNPSNGNSEVRTQRERERERERETSWLLPHGVLSLASFSWGGIWSICRGWNRSFCFLILTIWMRALSSYSYQMD
jgi:hypothetical protein